MIASCFSMMAFVAALLVGGLWTGNALTVVLFRALVIMLVCYPIGLLVGTALQRVLDEDIQAYKRTHPIPGEQDDRSQSPDDGHAAPSAEGS